MSESQINSHLAALKLLFSIQPIKSSSARVNFKPPKFTSRVTSSKCWEWSAADRENHN